MENEMLGKKIVSSTFESQAQAVSINQIAAVKLWDTVCTYSKQMLNVVPEYPPVSGRTE